MEEMEETETSFILNQGEMHVLFGWVKLLAVCM
jgi:hypothetical protein